MQKLTEFIIKVFVILFCKNQYLIFFFYVQLNFASEIVAQNPNTDYREYYILYNQYLICLADSNELDAYNCIKAALDKFDGFPGHYNIIINYELKKGNRHKAIHYAKKATSLGYQYYNEEISLTDEVDKIEFHDEIFETLLSKKYPNWRRNFIKKRTDFYEELNRDLLIMSNRDQYIRSAVHTEDSTTWHYTNEVDSVNYFYFRDIVNKYGYPQIRRLDNKASLALILLLCHFRTLDLVTNIASSEMNWLDSTMRQAVINGNLRPSDYAFFIDRYYNFKTRGRDEVQLYGEFNWDDCFTKIIDIQYVDKRRSEVFLIPLKYKAKLDQLPLPNEYRF